MNEKSLQMSGRDAMRDACIGFSIEQAWLSPGCGMPGAPQPPSLQLPDHVGDLSGVRTGEASGAHLEHAEERHRTRCR